MNDRRCPLCGEDRSTLFHEDGLRAYLRCSGCSLVFVPERFHLCPDEEKERYSLHENSPDDPEYRRFLNRLLEPMTIRLRAGSYGIDFGSGPGPAISTMMGERGFEMANYDPFFDADPGVLEMRYDFLTCTETVEHFFRPKESWELMLGLVRPGGVIGVMTEIMNEGTNFAKWHYIRDDTHVAFYSKRTLTWIAERYNLSAGFHGKSVVIFESRPVLC